MRAQTSRLPVEVSTPRASALMFCEWNVMAWLLVEEEDENMDGRKRANESDEDGRAKSRQVML